MQLTEQTNVNQRQLAERCEISLGSVNYVLKALAEKGWVKVKAATASEAKHRYLYQLTPSGVSAKVELIQQFMRRKQAEYEQLKQEADQLALYLNEEGDQR